MNKNQPFLPLVCVVLHHLRHSGFNKQQLHFSIKPELPLDCIRRHPWFACTALGFAAGYLCQPGAFRLFAAPPPQISGHVSSQTALFSPVLKDAVRVASNLPRQELPSRHSLARSPLMPKDERRVPPTIFHRALDLKVTAYTPINTPMEGGRWTATLGDGRAEHGVAVDPQVIPLGSRLWIPGYGYAVADDTGGSIKGNHIDIRVQHYDHMDDWGVRNLRVYVVEQPE